MTVPGSRLWRTYLLDRLGVTVDDVLDGALGIYGTQPTGHLAVLARLDGYGMADFDEAQAAGRAVRVRTLRGSGIVVPTSLIPIVQAATREKNVRAMRRIAESALETDAYDAWCGRILDLLAAGPMSPEEIRQALDAGEDSGGIRHVLGAMATENLLVSLPVTAGWRSSRRAYARWEDHLADVDVWSIDPAEARAALARVYLDRYGPASVADFAWWSGIGVRAAGAAFGATAEPIDAHDGGLWATSLELDDPPFGVRLLPVWDPLLVGYRDRSRFVDEEAYPHVYDRDGNATSVILVDGEIAGIWDLGPDDGELEIGIAPFRPLGRPVLAGVATEAARIGDMIGADSVRVVDHGDPSRLADASRNAFLRPLRRPAG